MQTLSCARPRLSTSLSSSLQARLSACLSGKAFSTLSGFGGFAPVDSRVSPQPGQVCDHSQSRCDHETRHCVISRSFFCMSGLC
jgi:hypothetical protein